MKKRNSKNLLFIGCSALAAFVLWTVLVKYVNVNAIGPNGSSVGFSLINSAFHEFTGVHFWLYGLTDWLGLVPFFFMFGFALLGLFQLIKRKSLFKVDFDILALGIFYIIMTTVYLLFEVFPINYRPVLINGILEVSYPSSTTLLVSCVMPTAAIQLKNRTKNPIINKTVVIAIDIFSVFMVLGRIISGVHWITDIIGGLLFSFGLVALYYSLINTKTK